MDMANQIWAHLAPMALIVLRLACWYFLLLAGFGLLERLFPLHRQKTFRRAYLVDIGYYFLNGILPNALLALGGAALAWGLRRIMPAMVLGFAAHLPFWGRLAGAMIVGEAGYYRGHRWMHEIPLLWRFHAVHHSAEEMDWLVNTRAHPVDIVFTRLMGFVPMYALGFSQPLAGQQLDAAPILFLTLGFMWGYFIHANLRWRFEWLSWLVSTPAFHHWHHTNDEHIDKNFASMLPVMDLIFGTWYLPRRVWPPCYGIKGSMAPGLAGQLVQPFLPQAEPSPPGANQGLLVRGERAGTVEAPETVP